MRRREGHLLMRGSPGRRAGSEGAATVAQAGRRVGLSAQMEGQSVSAS